MLKLGKNKASSNKRHVILHIDYRIPRNDRFVKPNIYPCISAPQHQISSPQLLSAPHIINSSIPHIPSHHIPNIPNIANVSGKHLVIHFFDNPLNTTECPKIYRISVLHLPKYTGNLYLSR